MTSRPLRILVVDDDPAMVGAITALVGTEGHQVITAYDGLTAVKRFREEHPDLVLLDLAMPGPDGFNVAGQMRAVGPAPILVVSGESGEAAKVRALGIGADDYLTKPFGKARAAGPDQRGDAPRRSVGGPGGSGGGPADRRRARAGAGPPRGPGRRRRRSRSPRRSSGCSRPWSGPAATSSLTCSWRASGWPAEPDPDLLWLKPHLARLRSKVQAAGGPQVVAVRGVGYRIVADEDRPELSRLRAHGAPRSGRARSDGERRSAAGRRRASPSAQSIRQPRASRPPNPWKWTKASPDGGQATAAGRTGDRRQAAVADGDRAKLGVGRVEHRHLPARDRAGRGGARPTRGDASPRSIERRDLQVRRRRRNGRRLGCGPVASAATSAADGLADRLDQPERGRQVRLVEQPVGELGAGRPMRLEEPHELDQARLAVRPIGQRRAEPDRGHAAVVERRRRGARSGRRGRPDRRSCRPRNSRPTGPRTTTVPPVMYSQPWGPIPSTTASAPLLRMAKRMPARPTRWSRPAVAPYSTVLPAIASVEAAAPRSASGATVIRPPDSPFAT